MFREFANISPSFDLESGWRVLMVLFGKVLKQLGLKMLFLFFLPKTHHLARPCSVLANENSFRRPLPKLRPS